MTRKAQTAHAAPAIRVGIPYSSTNEITRTASHMGAPVLMSAGAFRRKSEAKGSSDWRWAPVGDVWRSCRVALDTAGFVAMMQGGYRWTVDEHVEFVCTNRGDGSIPFPWDSVRARRCALLKSTASPSASSTFASS